VGVAEEGVGDESVMGLGARGKEQDLRKQNARLVVKVCLALALALAI
jgi:hypothetical protein